FARLSGGRVRDEMLECPYHGWQFAGDGRCVHIPGLLDTAPKIRARSYSVVELDGVVFLADGQPNRPPYLHAMAGYDTVARRVTSTTRSKLVDVAENILDATHTHFAHRGILRGLSKKRYRVRVDVTGGEDWVEACYTGEDRQHGLTSRLLEGKRTKTIGRFRYPGIAELEFWGPNGLVLVTTFHLRQSTADLVHGIAWLV
ncbi:MAG: Rieske 2Fe-2S domain-containing protein, partial [bacterium]|nr:Rieske 2Fe-2S domain-containing protein [bacterium]